MSFYFRGRILLLHTILQFNHCKYRRSYSNHEDERVNYLNVTINLVYIKKIDSERRIFLVCYSYLTITNSEDDQFVLCTMIGINLIKVRYLHPENDDIQITKTHMDGKLVKY